MKQPLTKKIAIANESKGFTIVELLIATAVFSLVLLVAISGFLEIGRLFYRGVSGTQTDTAAKQVLNLITADIQNASAVSPAIVNPPLPPPNPPISGYTYFCAGSNRYTLIFDKLVNLASPNYSANMGNFGVLRDELPGNNACAAPCVAGSCASSEVPLNSPQELLGNNMRLDALSIDAVGGEDRLRKVAVRILTGDNSTLSLLDPDNQPPSDGKNYKCDATLKVSQFCGTADLANIVFVGDYSP